MIMNTTPALTAQPAPLAMLFARPEVQGLALGLLAASIWGGYLAMARAGVSAGLHATDIAAIRYGVAGLIMLPWLVTHRVTTMQDIGMIRACVLVLLVGPLFILIGVGGYEFAPLAHGAVVQPAALTIGSIGLAYLVLGERPTRHRIIGIAVILAGLAVVAGPGLLTGSALTPLGDLMFASAGMMWALFSVISRRWGVSPVAGTAVVSVLSAAVYVPIYLLAVGADRLLATAPSMLLAQVIVQGVLSGVVAVIAFSKAVQLLGPGRAASFPAMVPAVAILLGIPVAGEIPTLLQFSGLVLVSIGLLVTIGVIALRPRSK